MTTYSNPAGNLDKKIVLSFPYDPERPDTYEQLLVESPKANWEIVTENYAEEDLTIYSVSARADHWQDTIHDTIRATSLGSGTLPVGAHTHLTDPSSSANSFVSTGTLVGGYDNAKDQRQSNDLTVANEFELDCNMITHTYQSLSGIAPLPGIPKTGISDTRSTAQLNTLNIDLGMQREIISCVGIIVDRKVHHSSSSGHHARRQHLLDIVRTQYDYIHKHDANKDKTWMNVNRFPALTIGPLRRISRAGQTHLDEGYEGEEPSDDVRGIETVGSALGGQYADAASIDGSGIGRHRGVGVNKSWVPVPSYKGRNRYRGLIARLNLRNEGGRPDVWQFTFDFIVVKNEMQMRMVGR